MTTWEKSALLLVGSPRGGKSTSASLGTYLLKRLQERGFTTQKINCRSALKTGESSQRLLAAVDGAAVVVLASPLYVDSPPYIVMRTMELIAAHRKATAPVGRPLFLAISNCGFPEAHHNDTALAIYRRFAREVGLDWAGGLALGAGESIAGRELAEAGGMVHKVRRALELSADALADGEAVPPEAVKLMAAPLMPLWLYLWGGNWGWKRQARNNGVLKSIKDRPYL